MIVGMNHFTVIAEDEHQTLDFYVGLLGLTVGHRPDLGFPGAWLYAGGPQAVLHMYFDRCERHEVRPAAAGGRRHLAAVLL
jgi:catechol 2,3-dioxygenase-like lactoylglutathione lyase family enzyme